VAGRVDDGHVVLGGLELPQGDVDVYNALALRLQLVHHPGLLEGALDGLLRLLPELLDSRSHHPRLQPPVGVLSWKGHRKFEAYLKFGPTVSASWFSTQMMPNLPRRFSIRSLEVIGMR